MRLTLQLAFFCLLAVACKKKPADEPKVAIVQEERDPQHGEFSLEQALEGIPVQGRLVAQIGTTRGTMNCELFADKVPDTVANFVGLARGKRAWRDPFSGKWVIGTPFYDDLAFHRVIPSYIIQGGDPLSRDYANDAVGIGDPGFTISDEVLPELTFDRPGRLAMANAAPGTSSGGSQFFITEMARPALDGKYTIFGQCDGLDAVKDIARAPVDNPQRNKPRSPIGMRIKIMRQSY